jgi:diguanylate cyclase (GGDEF)-like protein
MTSLHAYDREERPLLKLWNRTHGTDRLAIEMARARQDANHEFSVLLVEFEGLSDVTDRLGHASGQDVWRRVLGVLTHDLSARDLCCRLSGDEFLLILSARGQAECNDVLENIRRRWTPGAGSREASVEVNIGIASYPAHGSTIEELFGAADESLDANKLRNESIRSADGIRRFPQ